VKLENETFGMRLKKARMMKGWSMDQMVAALGKQLTKGAIAKYEAGEYLPREDKKKLLLETLGVAEDYFYKTINYDAVVTSTRSKDGLSERDQQMLAEQMLMVVEGYLELEQLLDDGKKKAFKQLDMLPLSDIDDAELAAEFWRLEWGAGRHVLGGLYQLLERHGIIIFEMESDIEFDGFTAKVNESIPVIVINSKINVERRRFTALHELAHLMLTFADDALPAFKEKLSNRFAGAALMPAGELKALLGSKRDSLYQEELIIIRNSYGISIQALAHRALELGIISQNTYYRIREGLSENKLEIGLGGYQGNEESRRFEQMTLKALAQHLITKSKAHELQQNSGRGFSQKLEIKW